MFFHLSVENSQGAGIGGLSVAFSLCSLLGGTCRSYRFPLGSAGRHGPCSVATSSTSWPRRWQPTSLAVGSSATLSSWSPRDLSSLFLCLTPFLEAGLRGSLGASWWPSTWTWSVGLLPLPGWSRELWLTSPARGTLSGCSAEAQGRRAGAWGERARPRPSSPSAFGFAVSPVFCDFFFFAGSLLVEVCI